MNKVTLATLSAIGGGIVGGTLTYLTVNRALRTRYEDWANSEINSVKHRYAQLNNDSKLDFIAAAENPSPEVERAIEEGKKLMQQMGYTGLDTDSETKPGDAPNETLSIFDAGYSSEMSEDEETEPDEAPEPEDDYKYIDGEPFKVSEGDYFENTPDYQLDTLMYYSQDDTLTDEKNIVIERVQETIGARHLFMFPKVAPDEKSSIYIQNDEHETIYEVIQVDASYAVSFLSMSEEDAGLREPKKKPRKMPKDHD